MRRPFALLLACTALIPARAMAQGTGTVHITVTLAGASGTARQPVLQTEDLLNDPRVSAMLASGFPLRLHYRVQIWRSRTFVDAQTYQTEWDVVVRHEPLLDQYQVAEVYRLTQRSTRFPGREELARYLGTRRLIKIGPTDPGEYYYVAAIEISTLSDTDIKELEQFLSGDVGPAATGGEPLGSALSNAIRRALLSVAGLPKVQVEGRSEKFALP
jgi:hypothetical protein